MIFTQKDMLKEARLIARDNGLTLKVDNTCYINGKTAYKIVDRKTGIIVKNWSAMTLNCAYQTLLSI